MKSIFLSILGILVWSAPLMAGTAYSPNITVDTRGTGDVTVTGRVLNGSTKTPLAGAAVTLAGLSTNTDASGAFTLANVDLLAGSSLTASTAGFVSQTMTVIAVEGEKAVNVGDILLKAATNKPVVESLKPDVDGILLPGFGLISTLRARVNWNGNTPGTVQFRVNGNVFGTMLGAGPEYSITIPVDSALQTSLRSTGNLVSVTATAQEPGRVSEPAELRMAVVPLPLGLKSRVSPSDYLNFGHDKLGFDFELTRYKQDVNLPLIGKFGFEWGANASFDYSIEDGEWEVAAGFGAEGKRGKRGRRPNFPGLTRSPKAKLYIGNKEINAYINGVAKGTATRMNGIVLSSFGLEGELETRLELTRYGLLDIFGPGLTNVVSTVPAVGKALKNVSIIVWLIPALEGEGTVLVSPFDFGGVSVTGKLGVEGAYEPEIADVFKGRFYVGADAATTFGLPAPVFKNVQFRLYGGYELQAWIFEWEKEVVWANYAYPASGGMRVQSAMGDPAMGYRMEAATNDETTWKPMDRPWREKGGEVFLASTEERLAGEVAHALRNFASMGELSNQPAETKKGEIAALVISSDLPTEAELPLLGNVFPNSDPALAGNGNNLMLLYVRDTGAANAVQFTEVAWTYFNGTTWTSPAPVAADGRGQFEPSVFFDGQGKAIAVWTRVKNAALSGVDLTGMAAELEIVTAAWDAGTGTWSAVTALTDNAFLDHKPRLAGPLTDGDLILTWRENQANLLIGTGIAGAPQNTRIMTRRWDATTGSWGVASVLVADLADEMSDSLAASGGKAVYAVTRDLDGNLDDFNDSELFYRVWNEGTGTWGSLTRHTTDVINDRNVKLAVGAAGDAYCIWQRGDDLMMDVNFSGTPSIVRPDSGTFGFSDLALTVGPAGNVAVIWQEMGEHGSDAHYRVYDPTSVTWGQDSFLSEDSDLERSFAPVWDAAGNLTLAYNNVQISKVTKNVVVEGGATVTVDGVPQPGQVDLLLAKRALVKDLAAVPEGLTADGTTFLPGDALTLKARVKNSGNLAVQNVQVAFYDGDPANGGKLIDTAAIPDWLEAATEAEVTVNWTVPEPAQARTIYIKIDPASTVTESDEANNILALPINGVDLALEYQSGSVLRDGSARVVVKVENLSSPDSPVTELKLWPLADPGSEPLASVSVSQLAPGQSVEIPLDLPPGTQGVGDSSYKLTIDEEGLIEDIDRENNEVLFSLNLPLDENGGFTQTEAATVRALPRRFVLGDLVNLDLSFLSTTGAEKISVLGLPKGLMFDPVTKRITGTLAGFLGEGPVEIRVMDGKLIARALLFNLTVSPHPFQGAYTALLETSGAAPLPTGMVKLLVTSTGAYTATLNLAGQTARSAKGSFTATAGATQQTISIPFLAGKNNVPPATTIQMTLPAAGSSDLVTGNRDGVSETLRGFRLAQAAKIPGATQKFTLAMVSAAPGDGVQVPAGTGTLTGTVDSKGVVKMTGFTGDAQTVTASFDLSQTHQAVFWTQPYKNKGSYLGGIMALGNLGLADRALSAESLTAGLKWFKQPDSTEKAYPSGFSAQSLEARASNWITAPNALALAESLGLEFSEIGASYSNPLAVTGLPTRFRLSEKFALMRIAPNAAVPWQGKATATSGVFAGSLTLPNGAGGVNGVFLQESSSGAAVGAGLVRVQLPVSPTTPKGSFQTIGIAFAADSAGQMTDGPGGFSDVEEAALNALGKRFVLGEVVNLDLSFLATAGAEKLAVLGLPKGLTFNSTTKVITGIITGMLGESPVEIRVLNGTQIVRTILFNMSVASHPFQGAYTALLETTDTEPLPTGQIKVLVTSTGAYTATLNLAGQAVRSAKGSLTAITGATQQMISIPFLAGKNNVPPATTIQMTLPAAASSDLVTGNRDAGSQTLRGFRLAQPVKTPGVTQKFTLAMINPVLGNGTQVPAGTGTLTGTVDTKGVVKLAGFTGDAQTVTASFDLSQTHQAVFWTQPYKNKASYLGGIMTMGNLGLADRVVTAESLTTGLKWFKQADSTEVAYPLGFTAQTLEARASLWISSINALALSDSLGLTFSEMGVSYRNPLALAGLPSRIRISEKLALMRIAPNTGVPWQGKANATDGAFSGSLTLSSGIGGVSGVLLQDVAFDSFVGAGLVRVPLPASPSLPKGSFQTIGIELDK